jgi:hypothetical protein
MLKKLVFIASIGFAFTVSAMADQSENTPSEKPVLTPVMLVPISDIVCPRGLLVNGGNGVCEGTDDDGHEQRVMSGCPSGYYKNQETGSCVPYDKKQF